MQLLAIKKNGLQANKTKQRQTTKNQQTNKSHTHKANNGKRKQPTENIRKAKVKFLLQLSN